MQGVRKVARYELLELLGRGGMADVYLAHVSGIADFKRLFAVKMIRTDLPEWERYGQFFIDEARITVLLRHPNIVQVFDLGMSEYGPFLGMEYVDGPDLRQLIGWSTEMRKGVPFNLAMFIARELLQALAYAHEAEGEDGAPLGLVHRDISPSNVLLSTSGEVKLSDFGVAMATIATQAQSPGAVVGKARYFAPEVARRLPATALSDQFSLGAVLFDLFTGKSLVEGDHYTEIVATLEVFDIDRRLDSVYSLPTELERFFRRALATNPTERFPSVRVMLDHLDDFMYEQGIRINRAQLSDYLKTLEEYIITTEGASTTGAPLPSARELSSVWTAARSNVSVALPGDDPDTGDDDADSADGNAGAAWPSALKSAPPRPPSTLSGNRRTNRAATYPQEKDHEISLPRAVTARGKPEAHEQPEEPAPTAQKWDQGAVLALPDASKIKLCDPHEGPIVLSEEAFDERLADRPPDPDSLLAFDGGELRPFHEWARMGNPRTTIRGHSQVLGASPLSIGPTLLKMVSANSGGGVLQLFDGRQAIGLIVTGSNLHGVWTESLGADLLVHLAERDVISRSQCQVLLQLSRGDPDSIPDLAARHGILSTARLFLEAREVLQAQLARVLVWPTWRINRLVTDAEGWGPERAGIEMRTAIERAARNVFSLDWFLGLMPDMLDATIRPRHRSVGDQLDKLLGKGTLRAERDLSPGSRIRDAVAKPDGSVDEDRAKNLFELVSNGSVELAQATAIRDFRRTSVRRDG